MRYASCATVNLVYRRKNIAHPTDTNGFFVPNRERRAFMACTFMHTKFPDRIPADRAVLRVFAGGPGREDLVDLDEGLLIDRLHGELAEILGIAGRPRETYLFRHRQAMPCNDTTLPGRLARIEAARAEQPGLFLAGGCQGTVGLPDSIASGKRAAEAAATFLEPTRLAVSAGS